MKTFVIVPVLDQWEHTRRLLNSLDADAVDDVLILDNGSTDETAWMVRSWQRQRGRLAEYFPLARKLHRTSRPDDSIYDLWNHGFARARRLSSGEPFCVLVTNNDIVLPRCAISAMRDVLMLDEANWVSYPDYEAPWDTPWQVRQPDVVYARHTNGVLSSGGMFGACFMLAGHRIPWQPLITDPNYRWWYADDHLAECIEQEGGRQARVVGLPVEHVNEATARHYPETWNWKLRDRGLWVNRQTRGLRALDRRSIVP